MSINFSQLKFGLWTQEDFTSHVLKSLLRLICPSCKDLIDPNYYPTQCQNGHLVCGPCGERETNCPICKKRFLKKPVPQNFILELAGAPRLCPHDGCLQIIPLNKVEEHKTDCEFKPFVCPLCGDEVGEFKNENFIKHLKEKHKNIFLEEKRYKFYLKRTEELQKTMGVLFAFGQFFIIELDPFLAAGSLHYKVNVKAVQIEGGFMEERYYYSYSLIDQHDSIVSYSIETLNKKEATYKGLRSCFQESAIIQSSSLEKIPMNSKFKVRVSVIDRYPYKELQAMGMLSPRPPQGEASDSRKRRHVSRV